MKPVLIGYFEKSIKPRPPDLDLPIVEVASVSGCIAERPRDWIEHWTHNEWWVYDSPNEALRVAAGIRNVRLYAYSVLPFVFRTTGEEAIAVSGIAPEPLTGDFDVLGYDVAGRSYSPEFECSPLSCNGLGAEVRVNEFCLIPSLEEAVTFARRCAVEQPEPGEYFVVEVAAPAAGERATKG